MLRFHPEIENMEKGFQVLESENRCYTYVFLEACSFLLRNATIPLITWHVEHSSKASDRVGHLGLDADIETTQPEIMTAMFFMFGC